MNKSWGIEETWGGCPIKPGHHFDIVIEAKRALFNVSVNGFHFCLFNYRIPLDVNAHYIRIEGECCIEDILGPE